VVECTALSREAGCRYAAESVIVMYKVYINRSIVKNRYYIGHAEDLENRLNLHNRGEVKSTKYGIPWETVYTEEFQTRAEACRREREIKAYKGGIKFKKLLGLFKDDDK